MISKKYLILNKAKEDFERRIEQGENIQFNFTCNSCKKRRLSSPSSSPSHSSDDEDYYYPMSPENNSSSSSSSSEYEEEEVIPKKVSRALKQSIISTATTTGATATTTTTVATTRRRSNSGANQASKKKNNVQNNGNANAQTECCIIGCDNGVTNRLRFSLRCHKEDEFKSEFLDQGWNKVCHYHYFSDLYKFKKMNKANKTGATAATTTTTKKKAAPKKTTAASHKRSRSEFESDSSSSSFEELTIVPTSVMIEQPLIPCKAVTPNTKIDASIFFSFVGGLNGGNNITKAM